MMKRYIFVVDGEVGPDIKFNGSGDAQKEALAAIMSSDPKVIEIPYDSPIDIGWTWDGLEFHPPVE